jgi:hypothetical protein
MIDIKRIEEIERLIFDFEIQPAMQEFASLTEEVILASGSLPPERLEKLLWIINMMNSALANKDYLLLNDLLEYELTPFIVTP